MTLAIYHKMTYIGLLGVLCLSINAVSEAIVKIKRYQVGIWQTRRCVSSTIGGAIFS